VLELCKIQLPGDTVAVARPGELAAEAVVSQRHEGSASIGECGGEERDLLLGFAVDEERECGRKREAVLDDAVGAQGRELTRGFAGRSISSGKTEHCIICLSRRLAR